MLQNACRRNLTHPRLKSPAGVPQPVNRRFPRLPRTAQTLAEEALEPSLASPERPTGRPSRSRCAAPILALPGGGSVRARSEEHTSELQSLMRISYAVFCLKKNKQNKAKRANMQP